MSLEKELGVDLLQRNGNRFSVTEDGQKLMRHFREMIEVYGDTEITLTEIKRSKPSTTNIIRFACVPSMETYGIISSIKLFHNTYPEIHILTEEMSESRVLYTLESNGCDFAFCPSLRIDTDLYETLPFCKDVLVVAVLKDSPLAKRESVSVSDLQNYRLITNRKESVLYNSFFSACVDAGFEPNVVFSTLRPDNAFVYIFDRNYAYVGTKNDILRAKPSDICVVPFGIEPQFEYHFAWKKHGHVPKAIFSYFDFIRPHISYFSNLHITSE